MPCHFQKTLMQQPDFYNFLVWILPHQKYSQVRQILLLKYLLHFIKLPSGRLLFYVKPRIGENQFGSESVTYEGVGSTKNGNASNPTVRNL